MRRMGMKCGRVVPMVNALRHQHQHDDDHRLNNSSHLNNNRRRHRSRSSNSSARAVRQVLGRLRSGYPAFLQGVVPSVYTMTPPLQSGARHMDSSSSSSSSSCGSGYAGRPSRHHHHHLFDHPDDTHAPPRRVWIASTEGAWIQRWLCHHLMAQCLLSTKPNKREKPREEEEEEEGRDSNQINPPFLLNETTGGSSSSSSSQQPQQQDDSVDPRVAVARAALQEVLLEVASAADRSSSSPAVAAGKQDHPETKANPRAAAAAAAAAAEEEADQEGDDADDHDHDDDGGTHHLLRFSGCSRATEILLAPPSFSLATTTRASISVDHREGNEKEKEEEEEHDHHDHLHPLQPQPPAPHALEHLVLPLVLFPVSLQGVAAFLREAQQWRLPRYGVSSAEHASMRMAQLRLAPHSPATGAVHGSSSLRALQDPLSPLASPGPSVALGDRLLLQRAGLLPLSSSSSNSGPDMATRIASDGSAVSPAMVFTLPSSSVVSAPQQASGEEEAGETDPMMKANGTTSGDEDFGRHDHHDYHDDNHNNNNEYLPTTISTTTSRFNSKEEGEEEEERVITGAPMRIGSGAAQNTGGAINEYSSYWLAPNAPSSSSSSCAAELREWCRTYATPRSAQLMILEVCPTSSSLSSSFSSSSCGGGLAPRGTLPGVRDALLVAQHVLDPESSSSTRCTTTCHKPYRQRGGGGTLLLICQHEEDAFSEASPLHASTILSYTQTIFHKVRAGRSRCGRVSFLLAEGVAGGAALAPSGRSCAGGDHGLWPHYLTFSGAQQRRRRREGGREMIDDQGTNKKEEEDGERARERGGARSSSRSSRRGDAASTMRSLLRQRAQFHRRQQGRYGSPKHHRPQVGGLSNRDASRISTSSATTRAAGPLYVPRILPRFATARYTPEQPPPDDADGAEAAAAAETDTTAIVQHGRPSRRRRGAPPPHSDFAAHPSEAHRRAQTEAAAARQAAWEAEEEAFFGVAFDMVAKGGYQRSPDEV